jgi:hypothetical protein
VTGSGLRKPLPSHANNLPSSLTFDPAAHAPWRTRPQPISKTAKKKEEPSFEDAPLEIAALESQPTPTHRNSENELIPPSALGVDCLQDCVCGFTLLPVCGSNRITYGESAIKTKTTYLISNFPTNCKYQSKKYIVRYIVFCSYFIKSFVNCFAGNQCILECVKNACEPGIPILLIF